uniref:Nipsnap homolog 3A n=1 Tax=Nannospalax galili TaxID=1026970 RepID=A0A8C6RNB4_NANGA
TLALRSSLNPALALRPLAPEVCSSFATGPRQTEGTFYEFCTYYLKPSMMNKFLENFDKSVHLRTAYSELIGYWSVKFRGRINRVFQIWKYDNFAHRTAVHEALFLIPNLALIDKQESEITYLVPWCKIGKPAREGESFLLNRKTFILRQGLVKLPGVALNWLYIHVLWWNKSADSRAAGRHLSHEDPRVVAAVRQSVNYLETQQNMLLIPTSFSPLK